MPCASRSRAPRRRERPYPSSAAGWRAPGISRPSCGTRRDSRWDNSKGSACPRTSRARDLSLPDRWILSRLAAAAGAVNRHLAEFRFDEAASSIYGFVWHELCDGYLEMVKPVLSSREARTGPPPRRREACCRGA